MGPILVRVLLLATGLAAGEVGVTALFSGDPAWIPELAIALALLFAGSAGFMGPLLAGGRSACTEVHGHE